MIGINPEGWNPIGTAQNFVTSKGLTFTNLWDETNAVWRHYAKPSTSNYWLIRKDGTRVGNNASPFSAGKIQRLLDGLE